MLLLCFIEGEYNRVIVRAHPAVYKKMFGIADIIQSIYR